MARNTHRLMVSNAKRVRRTLGCEENTREALEARADDRFGIGGPAGERDEAAAQVEGRAMACAAIGGGWRSLYFCVVELERLACEQLGYALGDQLVAMPLAFAEAVSAVAPVGSEAAGAFEAGDVAGHGREPRDKCMERPGPAWGLTLGLCVGVLRDGHAADYPAANTPADLAPMFPPDSWQRLLMGLEFVVQFPPNTDNSFPPNSCLWRGQHLAIDRKRCAIEAAEEDVDAFGLRLKEFADCGDCDLCSRLLRIAIDACRDGGKGDGARSVIAGEME
jgi:hypothetical protein